jgi:hypothetical protein
MQLIIQISNIKGLRGWRKENRYMKGTKKNSLLTLLIIVSVCFIVPIPSTSAAVLTPSINASGTGYNEWGSSVQVSLTTTTTNTLLYLSMDERRGATVTGVSSNPTLTWTKRGEANSYYNEGHMETWYAVWPSSGAITITVAMSSSATITAVAFAIAGADTTSPFDGNPRTIGSTSGTAGPMDPTVGLTITTSNPNDLIIGSIGITGYSDNPALTPGSGFSLIQTRASIGQYTYKVETSAEYKVVTTTQSGLYVSYSLGSTGYGSMVVDAVKARVVQSTTLTVACSPETVDKTGSMQTTIQGTLTSGTSGVSGKTITLTYNNGQTIGTATTQSDGSYSYSWTVSSSLANGFYALKAQFIDDNLLYDGSEASTTSSPGGGGVFVVPEYALGGLLALAACFMGFIAFKKRSSIPSFKHQA